MTDFQPRTASYQADPAEVRRVLLLYSGGLDTSVMLRWIGERYDAEVVTLTVNLGQPGEDYAVIEGKARRIGAVECHIVDAREEFAREYVVAVSGGRAFAFRALRSKRRALYAPGTGTARDPRHAGRRLARGE